MPPTIRLATPDDAEQVPAIYALYCHTPISFEIEPPSVEDRRGQHAGCDGNMDVAIASWLTSSLLCKPR